MKKEYKSCTSCKNSVWYDDGEDDDGCTIYDITCPFTDDWWGIGDARFDEAEKCGHYEEDK